MSLFLRILLSSDWNRMVFIELFVQFTQDFLDTKKYFLFKHFYMKLYTQRKNFAAKDVILKCRMFHQCDTVQGMQNETSKNNIKQNTFGIYRY